MPDDSASTKGDKAKRRNAEKPMLANYLAGYDQYQDFLVTQHGFIEDATHTQTKPGKKPATTATPRQSYTNRPHQSSHSLERWYNEYDQYQDFLVTRHGFATQAKNPFSKTENGLEGGKGQCKDKK